MSSGGFNKYIEHQLTSSLTVGLVLLRKRIGFLLQILMHSTDQVICKSCLLPANEFLNLYRASLRLALNQNQI